MRLALFELGLEALLQLLKLGAAFRELPGQVVAERSAPPACGGDPGSGGSAEGSGDASCTMAGGQIPVGSVLAGVSSSPGAMAEVTRARRPVAIANDARGEWNQAQGARPTAAQQRCGTSSGSAGKSRASIASCSASKRATAAGSRLAAIPALARTRPRQAARR